MTNKLCPTCNGEIFTSSAWQNGNGVIFFCSRQCAERWAARHVRIIEFESAFGSVTVDPLPVCPQDMDYVKLCAQLEKMKNALRPSLMIEADEEINIGDVVGLNTETGKVSPIKADQAKQETWRDRPPLL